MLMMKVGDLLAFAKANPLLAAGAAGAAVAASVVLLPLALLAATVLLPVLVPAGILGLVSGAGEWHRWGEPPRHCETHKQARMCKRWPNSKYVPRCAGWSGLV